MTYVKTRGGSQDLFDDEVPSLSVNETGWVVSERCNFLQRILLELKKKKKVKFVFTLPPE